MGIKIQFPTYYFAGGGGGAVWLGGSFGHLLILLWWNLFPLVIFSLFVVVFVGGGEGFMSQSFISVISIWSPFLFFGVFCGGVCFCWLVLCMRGC